MFTLRNAAIAAVLALTVSTGWAVLDGTAQGQSLVPRRLQSGA